MAVEKRAGSKKGTAGKAAGPAKAKVVKKALKRPTGELSKSNSSLAKFIKGSASGKDFTKAEARTAAGKYRDMANAKGGSFRSLDAAGVALGKAEAATKKMRKPAAKPAARGAKAGSSTVSKVGKALAKTPAGKVVSRAKTVAREVRDVPTAAANVIKSNRIFPKGGVAKFAKKDLKTQIKEVGTAIKSGKKGTQAATENYQGKKGTYVGGGGADYYISKPKKPRK